MYCLLIDPFDLGRKYKRVLCVGCGKKWCTSLHIDSKKKTNSNCFKQQERNDEGFCNTCSSKPSAIRLRNPGPSTNLPNDVTTQNTLGTYVRCSTKTQSSSTALVQQFSHAQMEDSIIKIIESIDKKQDEQTILDFVNMDAAKVYFIRKFTYCDHMKTKNLFEFLDPTASMSSVEEDDDDDLLYNKFFIDIDSAKTLYDTEYLNDICIDLFMKCFNLVMVTSCPRTQQVPDYLFGSCQDQNFIVPQVEVFRNIYRYLDASEVTEDLSARCTEDVRAWYCNNRKNNVSNLLDAYRDIKNYVTCINLSNKTQKDHWIVLIVSLDNDNSTPYVHTFDSIKKGKKNTDDYDENEQTAKIIRLWYAKYFALYLKERDYGSCDLVDFDIASLRSMINFEKDVPEGTMIDQGSVEDSKLSQKDSYNCGIYCLRRCSEYVFKIENESTCEVYRLKYLSIIAKIYELLNKDQYDEMEHHLYMKEGNAQKDDDIQKFRNVHAWFRANPSKLDLLSMNANTKFLEKDNELGKAPDAPSGLLKKRRLKKDRKSKKHHPSTASSSVSRKYPRLANSLTGSVEYPSLANSLIGSVDVPPYSLETVVLGNVVHTRTNQLIDFSDKLVVLDKSEYKETMDLAEKNKITMNPSLLVSTVKTFFRGSYMFNSDVRSDNESVGSDDEFAMFAVRVDRLMKQFVTYVVFDHCHNNKNGRFSIVGAFIVEKLFDHNKQWCSIIHLVGTSEKIKTNKEVQVLLHKGFHETDLWNNRLYVVTDFGNITMHDCAVGIFETIGFTELKGQELSVLQEDLHGSIPDNATIMTGIVSQLKNSTEHLLDFGMDSGNCAVHGCITNFQKKYFKVTEQGIHFYTPAFQWNLAEPHERTLLSMKRYKSAWNSKGSVFVCKDMYGSRNASLSTSMQSKMKAIPSMFKQSTHSRENSCCWLTFALLVHVKNPAVAVELVEKYKKDYDRFDWLSLTKLNRDIVDQRYEYGHQSLQDIVERDIKCGYRLKRKKHSNGNQCHIEFLLQPDSKGLYICVTQPRVAYATHVIGINCDDKVIYDCEEDFELKLTKDNIDLCCGMNSGGVEAIRICFEIISDQTKTTARCIPSMFQHSTYNREHSCCWLMFALLVHVMNPTTGVELVNMYKNDLDQFERLGLSRSDDTILTIQEFVQKEITCGYQMKRKKLIYGTKSHLNKCHIDFLLNPHTDGLYLCIPKASPESKANVIGINCNEKKIYDSDVLYELELTEDNINRCCGNNNKEIAAIKTCYEIVEQQQKKSKSIH